MSEQPKKVVGRNVAVALAIICVILGGVLSGSIYNYTSIIGSKDSQIQTLIGQNSQLKDILEGNITSYSSQTSVLQAKVGDLQNQISQKELQVKDLQNQIAQKDSQITNLQNGISEKDKTIAEKNGEISDLKSQIASLQSQIATLQNQATYLQNQIDALKAPKLIEVDLRAEDKRPWFQTPYLHVYGYVCNVGTNTAYDSKLHVVAYQSGRVIAKETDILLGTVAGESYAYVDVNVYYSGSPIVSYEITLYWQGGKTQYTSTAVPTTTVPTTTTATATATTASTTSVTTTATALFVSTIFHHMCNSSLSLSFNLFP